MFALYCSFLDDAARITSPDYVPSTGTHISLCYFPSKFLLLTPLLDPGPLRLYPQIAPFDRRRGRAQTSNGNKSRVGERMDHL